MVFSQFLRTVTGQRKVEMEWPASIVSPKLNQLWIRLTAFVTLNGIVLGCVLSLLAALVVPSGFPGEGVALLPAFFRFHQQHDSLEPMVYALQCYDQHLPIYDTVFFQDHVKFQYPLTSLIPLQMVRVLVGREHALRLAAVFNAATWLSVWVVIGVSLALFIRASTQSLDMNRGVRERILAFSIPVLISGLTFFPLIKGYEVGQIQAIISALFSVALYCWFTGRNKSAGVLLALMTLLKPQYALFTIWLGLRKKLGAFCANLAVLVAGAGAAVAFFGWQESVKYFEVLSFMAKRGEAFYVNFSINGLLNRALLNGDNLVFQKHAFAPYHPFVYAATVATSILLIGLALWYPFGAGRRSKVEDFCTLAVTATVASPIAWDHHYGILFPIFALFAGAAPDSKHLAWCAGAYLLISRVWIPLHTLAAIPYLNALQSLPLLGIFMLLALLYLASLQGPVGEREISGGQAQDRTSGRGVNCPHA